MGIRRHGYASHETRFSNQLKVCARRPDRSVQYARYHSMALTHCTQCGREIEPMSSTCPHCGAASTPSVTGKKGSPLVIIAILAVVVGVGGYFAMPYFVGSETRSATEAKSPADVESIKTKAEQGLADAQQQLGSLYSHGDGVKQDYKEAAKWYRLAADKSNTVAQTALGELYEVGQGVPKDEAEAARWYRAAAEQGYTPAQYNLAVLYVTGKGVTANVNEALKWYRKAAEHGDSLAQYNLGMRFFEGNGVKADPVEAYYWLSLAADQKQSDAVRVREQLRRTITPDQLAEAKRRLASKPAKAN